MAEFTPNTVPTWSTIRINKESEEVTVEGPLWELSSSYEKNGHRAWLFKSLLRDGGIMRIEWNDALLVEDPAASKYELTQYKNDNAHEKPFLRVAPPGAHRTWASYAADEEGGS